MHFTMSITTQMKYYCINTNMCNEGFFLSFHYCTNKISVDLRLNRTKRRTIKNVLYESQWLEHSSKTLIRQIISPLYRS